MADGPSFEGFPEAGLEFLEGLAANNNRDWFEAHRDEYAASLLVQAQLFVAALGERMLTFAAGLTYDTATSGAGSILRINRDVRFSTDKRPYHTQLRIVFWEGPWKKMENPSLYIGVTPDDARLYAGVHAFNKPLLAAYRNAVADEARGAQLGEAISLVRATGGYKVGGEHYKRVPRGYDPDHPRAGLLRYNGLHVALPRLGRDLVTRAAFVDACAESFARTDPLHQWLVDLANEAWSHAARDLRPHDG